MKTSKGSSVSYSLSEHFGEVLLLDQSVEVRLSGHVMKSTFDLELWYAINHRADVLIDSYEAEDMPVEKLDDVADEIRNFLTSHDAAISGEVKDALDKVLGLITKAKAQGQTVRFAF